MEAIFNANPRELTADQRKLNDLTWQTVGLSHKVAHILGNGFTEHVYRNALAFELRTAEVEVKTEWPIKAFYQDEVVGIFRADLLVENCLLVEIKACTSINAVHVRQCLNYLKASHLRLCQLINFSPTGVQTKRLVCNF